MPILLALSTLIQALLIVHALKTGRRDPWLWIILFFPGIGSALYAFFELLPEMRRTREGRLVAAKILKAVDPHRDLKRLTAELTRSDNVENKVNLAKECVNAGMYKEAIELYQSSLKGIYLVDPNIMLGLATAQFHQGDYADSKQTLEDLIKHNPEFKSAEGHLLYTRSLEGLEQYAAALEEYQSLTTYYAGYEAKCRYALLLKKLGHTEKAQQLFKYMITHAKNLPRGYQLAQKQWIDIAKSNL
ncbi:MAG: tetratricopeptide repeat protein [Thiotrichaceae bacterium]